MVRVVGVRFRTAGKIYFFDPLDFSIKRGENVIVETARVMLFSPSQRMPSGIFSVNSTE